MTTKANNNSSDHFDSNNTPNFLTKGVEVDQKTEAKQSDEKSVQGKEPTKGSSDSSSSGGPSFGFFTPDSRVRSFSPSNNHKRGSSSRWNSGAGASGNGGRGDGGPSSNEGRNSYSEGASGNGGRGDSGRDKEDNGGGQGQSKRSPRGKSDKRLDQPEFESSEFMDTDDMERSSLKYGERGRGARDLGDSRGSREEEEINIESSKIIDANNLRKKSMDELVEIAKEYGVNNVSRLLKHNIISSILKAASSKGEIIQDVGVIELVADNYGFLRYPENNYVPSSDNIYVSQNQVKRFGLKTGDLVEGYAKEPRRSEKYFPMFKVVKINGCPVDQQRNVMHFDNFTPIFPKEKLNLDLNIGPKEDVSTRVIDIIAPIGKGQRALIVAPPRSGKTVIMKNIANAINTNHPDVKLIVLLIDERPEEFTDMMKCVTGEVVSSTFDEPAERHVALAEIIISKSKRMVEQGQDVVILLDSITRLARAYNAIAPSSGKILTGGIDSNALQRPKRFFGAARNITGPGSLTIIATALVDTGSKMDEVIFEEFKGRGNSEIVLDRRLADKRVFPAIDVLRSGTRNEEEMVSGETLSKMWALRKIIGGMNDQVKAGSSEAIDFLLKEIKKTANNSEFFTRMNG